MNYAAIAEELMGAPLTSNAVFYRWFASSSEHGGCTMDTYRCINVTRIDQENWLDTHSEAVEFCLAMACKHRNTKQIDSILSVGTAWRCIDCGRIGRLGPTFASVVWSWK